MSALPNSIDPFLSELLVGQALMHPSAARVIGDLVHSLDCQKHFQVALCISTT